MMTGTASVAGSVRKRVEKRNPSMPGMMLSVMITSGSDLMRLREAISAIERRVDFVLFALENHPQKVDDGLAVVDDQDSAHEACGSLLAFGRLPDVKR